MDDQRNLPIPEKYARFSVSGDELLAVFRPGEGMAVPVRLVCERLGLNTRRQTERLLKHPVLSRGMRRDRVPVGSRVLDVDVLLHKYIAFWLATISPDQVAKSAYDRLVAYQTEVADILAAIYLSRADGPPQDAGQMQLTQLGEQIRQLVAAQQHLEDRVSVVEEIVEDLRQFIPVTPAQAEFLLRSLKRIGARYQKKHQREIYGMLIARFKADMGMPRYDALPAAAYEHALDWIEDRARENLPGDDDALPPRQERLL